MALDVLELTTSRATLRLASDETRWCRVSVVAGSLEIPLGADAEEAIVGRRKAAVSAEAPPGLGTAAPMWVLSLAELHASVYAQWKDRTLDLTLTDADAKLIQRMPLGQEQRWDWTGQVQAWTSRGQPLRIDEADARDLPHHPPYVVHALRTAAAEVVRSPTAAFRGLRRRGLLRQGFAWSGRPGQRLDNEGMAQPAPEGMVFCVYASPDGCVFDWDWVREDRDDPSRPDGSSERFSEALPALSGRAMAGLDSLRSGRFSPGNAWYSVRGDCVFCYLADDPAYAERATDDLTVYRSLATGAPVGFKVKNVAELVSLLMSCDSVKLVGSGVEVELLRLLTFPGHVLIRQTQPDREEWVMLVEALRSLHPRARVTIPADCVSALAR